MPTFTALALVQTHTQTTEVYRWDAATGTHVSEGTRTETRENGRIEFIAVGDWTLVRMVRIPGEYGRGGCWTAYTAEDARKLYQAHLEGRGWYQGKWEAAPAVTRIVGSVDQPARRVDYQWGETAYMYQQVDLPAMTCPVLEMERGERCALQPFTLKVGRTKGDPYGHTSNRIEFTDVAA